eukprot:TRINITY_DN1387_c0_g1_i1.p1 TRINITY_DN1387_c0_g1~~TRINITY_DN1387_c0_g1_i1.p1  ORF type:complete len:604 (-),score=159.94 TRINITY_DN1387_c0_g1_i1:138-1949(-)
MTNVLEATTREEDEMMSSSSSSSSSSSFAEGTTSSIECESKEEDHPQNTTTALKSHDDEMLYEMMHKKRLRDANGIGGREDASSMDGVRNRVDRDDSEANNNQESLNKRPRTASNTTSTTTASTQTKPPFQYRTPKPTRVPFLCSLLSSKTPADLSLRNEQSKQVPDTDKSPIPVPKYIRGPVCYLCKKRSTTVHWFYHSACPQCGDHAFVERHRQRDLTGKQALVTGARLKLGYQVALKLLRAGAEVMVTTRKPQDLIDLNKSPYALEPDFASWKDRLHMCSVPLDLSKIDQQLPELIAELHRVWPNGVLDILVHNAAQTIWNPPEASNTTTTTTTTTTAITASTNSDSDSEKIKEAKTIDLVAAVKEAIQEHSTNPNKKKYPPKEWFPSIETLLTQPDRYGRLPDARALNSWNQPFGTVHPEEAKQVLLGNAWAPFVLDQALLPMLQKSTDAYVLHVHAREGMFSVHKTVGHTHTNMAKAALAMLTRCTAGSNYNHISNDMLSPYNKEFPWAKDQNTHLAILDKPNNYRERKHCIKEVKIHGVNPGWFSVDEYTISERVRKNLLAPPIDEIDAAARILNPVWKEAPSFMGTWVNYVPNPMF